MHEGSETSFIFLSVFDLHLFYLQLSPSFLLRQGYPCELLPLTVAGIPSMHICLDFIPELIAQPELEKQVTSI